MFLDRCLPDDVARVIFLDVDTLVLGSLTELWSWDLAGNVLAAARDVNTPTLAARHGVPRWQELGLDGRAPYLNAGVLVVDRAAWRAEELERRSIEYLQAEGDNVILNDQEALNACLAGAWSQLPLRWNAQVDDLRRVLGRSDSLIYSAVPHDEVAAALHDPAVVHFSGNRKPWLTTGAGLPATERWVEVLSRTPWAGTPATKPPPFAAGGSQPPRRAPVACRPGRRNR